MYNYKMPGSDPKSFFGLGERNGNFFLQDNYQYTLYNNNNNLSDVTLSNGRVI